MGCSIIANKMLPTGLKEPLFWHIDRSDSLERARSGESGEHRVRCRCHFQEPRDVRWSCNLPSDGRTGLEAR
jgi:hypothetical protein